MNVQHCALINLLVTADWYCCDICKSGEKVDATQNYSLRLLESGLKRRVRVDAVREGDGPRILHMWRIDILQFNRKHHPRYLRLAHRLLACMICMLLFIS